MQKKKDFLSLGELHEQKEQLKNCKSLYAILIYESEYDVGLSQDLNRYINTITQVYLNGAIALVNYLALAKYYNAIEIIKADSVDNLFNDIEILNQNYHKPKTWND